MDTDYATGIVDEWHPESRRPDVRIEFEGRYLGTAAVIGPSRPPFEGGSESDPRGERERRVQSIAMLLFERLMDGNPFDADWQESAAEVGRRLRAEIALIERIQWKRGVFAGEIVSVDARGAVTDGP